MQAGASASTHAHILRVAIIDDEDLIAFLNKAILENCRWINRLAYRVKVGAVLVGWFGYAHEMNKACPKIEAALQAGQSFQIMPTALIFVIGLKKAVLRDACA